MADTFMANGRPTIEAIVPPDAEPGVTQISVDMQDQSLLVTVPPQAIPGDRLCIEQNENKEFTCTISRRTRSEGGEECKDKRLRVVCLVPPGVSPGDKLEIDAGDRKVIVKVPERAKTGDKFILTREESEWTCTLVHDVVMEREVRQIDEFANLAPPRAPPMDADLAYARLKEAVRNAGGLVNEKMARGAVPPLYIPGMVATAPIEAGEELCVIPQRLHISPTMIQGTAPQLMDAVRKIQTIPAARHEEAAQSAFMAQLLLEADARALARERQSEELPEEGYMPEATSQAEPLAKKVWEAYADDMLREDFSYHPYRRAAVDPEGVRSSLLPSPEVDFFVDMAGDIIAIHRSINASCPKELLGPRFGEVSMFFRGKLSVLTRVFQTSDSSTVVPVADLFNHRNQDISSASWEWNANRQALIVKAERRIEVGEEICESYGPRSNTLLLRTYGFTQSPEIEPSWSFCMRPEQVRSIFDVFMPQELRAHQIIFDAKHVEDSLVTAMNAAAANKQNASEFVKLCCVRCRENYLADPKLHIPIEALHLARAADRTSGAWWDFLPAGQESLKDDEGIRIKMSEFLCLETQIEAVKFAEGKVDHDQCFAMGLSFRKIFKDAVDMIKKMGRFTVQFVPPDQVE